MQNCTCASYFSPFLLPCRRQLRVRGRPARLTLTYYYFFFTRASSHLCLVLDCPFPPVPAGDSYVSVDVRRVPSATWQDFQTRNASSMKAYHFRGLFMQLQSVR